MLSIFRLFAMLIHVLVHSTANDSEKSFTKNSMKMICTENNVTHKHEPKTFSFRHKIDVIETFTYK